MMNEGEAIRAGGTLHSRDNPFLCEIYALRWTRKEARDKLAFWRTEARAASTKAWREVCRGCAADWLAIIAKQQEGSVR